jgi:hypothetical protein
MFVTVRYHVYFQNNCREVRNYVYICIYVCLHTYLVDNRFYTCLDNNLMHVYKHMYHICVSNMRIQIVIIMILSCLIIIITFTWYRMMNVWFSIIPLYTLMLCKTFNLIFTQLHMQLSYIYILDMISYDEWLIFHGSYTYWWHWIHLF